jgi:hypothetical protein
MRLEAKVDWIARPAGGLSVGLSFHFPITVIEDEISSSPRFASMVTGSLALLFFRVTLYLSYNERNEP